MKIFHAHTLSPSGGSLGFSSGARSRIAIASSSSATVFFLRRTSTPTSCNCQNKRNNTFLPSKTPNVPNTVRHSPGQTWPQGRWRHRHRALAQTCHRTSCRLHRTLPRPISHRCYSVLTRPATNQSRVRSCNIPWPTLDLLELISCE